MKFCIKDSFSKCDQIRSFLIWSRLLKKSLTKNFIFCVVYDKDVIIKVAIWYGKKHELVWDLAWYS